MTSQSFRQLLVPTLRTQHGSSGRQLAERDGRSGREDPKGRIHGLREGEHERVEGVGAVGDRVEGGGAAVAVQQHSDASGVGVLQHRLSAVVPCRQLDVEPLHAPGLVIASQPTAGALAVDGAVGQAQAAEVVAAHLHLPVVAALREALGAQHLRADREALGPVRVLARLLGHRRLGEILGEGDTLVSRFVVQLKHCTNYEVSKNTQQAEY